MAAAVSPVELAQDSFSKAVLSDYNSLDVALDVSIDNRAWWPDLGSVSQNDHHRLTNLMQSDGFDVVSDTMLLNCPLLRSGDTVHLLVDGAH